MRRVLHMLVVSLVVFGVSVAGVAAQEATPASDGSLLADLGYPEIRVTSDGTTHDFPAEVEAGRYHVVLENTSDLEVDLEFFQLPEGVTMEDFVAFIEETSESPEFVLPDYFYDVVFNGGPIALPGETSGVVLDLTPGEWVVNHVTYNLETEDPGTNTPTAITVTGPQFRGCR